MSETPSDSGHSLPEDLLRALLANDAPADNPLLDDTPLAYADPLDAAAAGDALADYPVHEPIAMPIDEMPQAKGLSGIELSGPAEAIRAPETLNADPASFAAQAALAAVSAAFEIPRVAAEEPQATEAAAPETPLSVEEMGNLLDTLDAPADQVVRDAAAGNELPLAGGDFDAIINTPVESAGGGFDSLLGVKRDEDVFSAADLDSLLGIGAPAAAAAASPAPADTAKAPEPLSQDLLDALLASAGGAAPAAPKSDVGLENLAAAATPAQADGAVSMSNDDFAALAGRPPAALRTASASPGAPAATPVAETAIAAGLARRGPGFFAGPHAVRAVAAAATGVTVAICTYLSLAALAERQPKLAEVVAQQPKPLDAVVARAKDFIDAHDFAGALRILDDAVPSAAPGQARAEAKFMRAEASYKLFDHSPYSDKFEVILRRIDDAVGDAPAHPRAAEVLRWKAKLYEEAKLSAAAAETYTHIIKQLPDAPEMDAVLLDAARVALQNDDTVQAAEYALEMLKRFPASAHTGEARLLAGDAYAKAGMTEEARGLYQRVAQGEPGPQVADAHYRLGKLAYDQKQYEAAIKDLSQYLDSTTNTEGNERVFVLLAKAQRAAGQPAQAKQTLEGVINFFADSDGLAEAYVELSQLLEEQGERERGLSVAQQAAARFPHNPVALRNSGEFLGLMGNPYGAATALEAAEKAGAADPELLLAAGRYYAAAGMLKDARRVFEQAAGDYPRSNQAVIAVSESAQLAYKQGEVSEAVSKLNDAITATHSRAERVYPERVLAQIKLDLGLNDSAIALVEDIAGLSDEAESLADCTEKLVRADALDRAEKVFARVDLGRLRNQRAYELLNVLGEAQARVAPERGLERLETAYLNYPNARTPAGALRLLEAYLATGRGAAARRVVTELGDHVREQPADAALLVDAAIAWGDWLYARGDYRTAKEAFDLASATAHNGGKPLTGTRKDPRWAQYQRANVLFALADYKESYPLYAEIAKSSLPWSQEAALKAQRAQLELQMRGGSAALASAEPPANTAAAAAPSPPPARSTQTGGA